jgi:hypothetical protein
VYCISLLSVVLRRSVVGAAAMWLLALGAAQARPS